MNPVPTIVSHRPPTRCHPDPWPARRSGRWLWLPSLTLLLLALVLTGCGGSGEPDTIALGIAQAPQNLDPRLATDAASSRVNRLLYTRLVEFDAASRPIPGIAHWEQPDPRTYRFTLGSAGRDFSDGSRLNAADVAATYRSVLDPASASPHRATLANVAALVVLDDDRLEFQLHAPDPEFPNQLGLGILPARLLEAGHNFRRAPVGSGAVRLVRWPKPGLLILERRTDGQRLALVTVRDANVRVMKLLRGEVDLLQNDLPPELIGLLQRRDGIRVQTRPGINYSYLGFNLQDPATGDPRVRQAIAHAIDREAILRYLFQGHARTAEGLFPPEHWAGNADLLPYAHDPAQARTLLAAAGFGLQQPLRLSLKTSSDPFRLRLASVLQAQLAAAGIEARVQSYDWGTFFGDILAGRFQLYGLTWVGVRTPDIFRYAFHSAAMPPEGANRGRYHNAVVDRLIDAARLEPRPEHAAALYRALQQIIHDDLPYIPLWFEDQVLASRGGISGYRLASDGNYDGLLTVRRGAAAATGSGAVGHQREGDRAITMIARQ